MRTTFGVRSRTSASRARRLSSSGVETRRIVLSSSRPRWLSTRDGGTLKRWERNALRAAASAALGGRAGPASLKDNARTSPAAPRCRRTRPGWARSPARLCRSARPASSVSRCQARSSLRGSATGRTTASLATGRRIPERAARHEHSSQGGAQANATPSRRAGTLFSAGVQCHQAGRLAEAERAHRLASPPTRTTFGALNNLGMIMPPGEKEGFCFRKALELRPDYVDSHVNLAGALAAAGDAEGAVSHYRQALLLRPDRSKSASRSADSFSSANSSSKRRNAFSTA